MDEKDLPSIEDEFAELDAELKRITSLPLQTPEQRNALLIALESIRADWLEKGKAHGDAIPVWRKMVDVAVATAFDGLIADLATTTTSSGELSFDNKLVQQHLAPVLDALASGLREHLVRKFGKRPPPGQKPPIVDSTDVAAMLLTLFGPPPKKK